MPVTHKLKTWPQYYERILSGEKTFEIRFNDRDFQAGDILVLQEYDPFTKEYSCRQIIRTVLYVLHDSQGVFGLKADHVIMSLSNT